MDTRPTPQVRRLVPEKRPQKYLHFALQPGDEELVARLPPFQQAALRAEGSYANSAREQNVPIGTFRSRLHRARAAIVKMREQRTSENVQESAADPDSIH